MKNIILFGVLFVFLSGCASIVSKSEYSVGINSNPDAANFSVVNKAGEEVHNGVTPATVKLKPSSGYFKGELYTITFKKEGYPDKTFTMKSAVDGWYFGNILLGGFIGMLIVDPVTGAMYKLPETVDVSLDPETSQLEKDQLTIATMDSLSSQEKKRLVKIN